MTSTLFADLQIHPEIKSILEKNAFNEMTAVQKEVITEFFKKDVIVQSQTGSGKTLAYLIPILQAQYTRSADKNGILGLIIVPTRELSIQVQELLKLFNCTNEIFIGGMPIEADFEKLKNPFSVAIGTPGRLQEVISNNSKLFGKLKYVVLDESDKLLSFGFEAKLQRILAFLPKNRLTGLFSATINESVNSLALSFLKNPLTIKISDQIPDKLNLKYLIVSPKNKLDALMNLVHEKRAIVFFSTCNTTDYFYNLLQQLYLNENTGVPLHKIHGKMDQNDRNKIYNNFESSGGILMCTDVAARGIDFKNIDIVVHFDVPKDHENIVHRSGRTARNGKNGESVILLMHNERSMIDFLKLKGIIIAEMEMREKYNELVMYNKGKNAINKELLNLAVKSFVSYIRGYKEHILNYILNFKELDFDELAQLHYLERIPAMPELKNVKFEHYNKPEHSTKRRKLKMDK